MQELSQSWLHVAGISKNVNGHMGNGPEKDTVELTAAEAQGDKHTAKAVCG
jgi:hypothetical protein